MTFPLKLETTEKFKSENIGKIIIKETALLFEANIVDQVDKIVLVAANDELRINRVMTRDGLSKQEVLKKIKAQLPQEEKIKLSDFVIYNNEEDFLHNPFLFPFCFKRVYSELF